MAEVFGAWLHLLGSGLYGWVYVGIIVDLDCFIVVSLWYCGSLGCHFGTVLVAMGTYERLLGARWAVYWEPGGPKGGWK